MIILDSCTWVWNKYVPKGWHFFVYEKNETKEKEVIILNVAKGTHRIEIIVYYQDLLKNWYSQKIYLVISVTNIYDSKTGNCDHIDSFIVNDEEKMINEPSIIKMLNKDLIK